MNYFRKNLGYALLSFTLTGGLSAVPADETTQPAPAAVQETAESIYVQFYALILEQLEKDSIDLSFPKNSAVLGAAQKTALDAMILNAKADKSIHNVIVAAWSDSPYPAAEGEKLSNAERKLADKRAENIKKYLKSKKITHVTEYSMAEKPSWVAKVFHMDEAQLKGAVPDSKTDSLNEERIRKVIDTKGGPSKAVVFFKREWKNESRGS